MVAAILGDIQGQCINIQELSALISAMSGVSRGYEPRETQLFQVPEAM